jgi:predicted ATPase
MLEKVILENYRCYDHHTIDLKDLSIIVGKNNAGKSTLVEALRFVAIAVSRFRTSIYHPVPNWLELPARAKGVNPSIKSFGFNTENLFHNYGSPPSQITALFSNNITVKIYIGQEAEIFCNLIDSNGVYITTRGAASQLDIPTVNILPVISPIQKEERILNREYVRQNLSTELASIHFRNQLALLYESYPRFTELAEQSWSGLRIRSFEGRSGLQGNNDKLSLLIQDGNFVSEIGWMGSGLQMWLQIMWFLSRVNEQEIVILDEPDVYMHPELQRKLIRLLRNRYKQVIVSTHSIEIISEVEPANILIIDKLKSKSLFANKVPVVQRILNSIGSIHNLQLTRLWASKKLVIVEGDDIDILKRLQNKLFPKSDEPFDSIPNFDIGGWGGWSHARGSSMLLKETVDDEVKIYCIFDSDYHTEEEINERKREAEKIKVNIHIWAKKELENYLILPTTILRILKSESKKAFHLVVSEIETVVLQETKQMEDELIDKLADCIQKKDRKHSISSARKIAKARIDRLENRVCGKDLISSLSKWTQSNFNVSLSPIKIAACMEVSEISSELKSVLQKIEKCHDF